MKAEIIEFPQDELIAQCPECDGTEWYVIVTPDRKPIGMECINCGWGSVEEGE